MNSSCVMLESAYTRYTRAIMTNEKNKFKILKQNSNSAECFTNEFCQR